MDLVTAIVAILSGSLTAIEQSESAHLVAMVNAMKAVAGKALTVDDVLAAYNAGILPDYYVGESVSLAGQLIVNTGMTRTIGASGGIVYGPVNLTASFSQQNQSSSQSNLSVNITMNRQSRTKAIENMMAALNTSPAPTVAIPTGSAPNGTKTS